MIDSHRVIAMIPARGGSKSIPGKNIRLLGDKPLMAWAVETALSVDEIDRVIVSTDSEAIAEVARMYGAEVYERPGHLATDTALVLETVRDLMGRLRARGESALYGVLLEPTAPFRRPEDIRACLQRLHEEGLDSVATFKPVDLNPHRAWRLENGEPQPFIDGSIPWLPRQQLPEAYQLSGEVYAFRVASLDLTQQGMLFGRMGAVVVDGKSSLDIDDEHDFRLAEWMIREERHESITA
ncbi:acylneuraminate cytidylyltransferase family protein [Aidingimonas lacisalsi]|uniref:acylneuraminate cytidylyltransferase family protein n=1 Tax=Aidingimonas lacisalsi TaxID=2604086 RepID=UPI0011D1A008|nr:acylneuraminate cytidylyltransferase family protein [Aidingimonas lacisalsi]